MPAIKTLKSHKVLFDTHIYLWHMFGDSRLSLKFRKSIEKIQQSSSILVSPMTFWEIGMLSEKGKIQLEMDSLDWVEKATEDPGFQIAELSPKIAIFSSRLPDNIHGDPADRIIIATAFENHAVLVTCDEKILAYGQNHFLSVHDPR